MRSADLFFIHTKPLAGPKLSAAPTGTQNQFAQVLASKTNPLADANATATAAPAADAAPAAPPSSGFKLASAGTTNAAAAYQKQAQSARPAQTQSDAASGWQKYKEDQLLRHPGGDHYQYSTEGAAQKIEPAQGFWDRIGKDFSDAMGNIKNFFDDAFFGAKVSYVDESNQIKSANRRGILGAVVDIFKDLGSALSFGNWRPDGEAEPKGVVERAKFFVSKVGEAVLGDMVQGVARGVVHMGKDLLLAGWNLLEVVPDATIGNLEAGRKATTTVFDNGQVAIDYVTDVFPAGDAWARVHTADFSNGKLPVQNNIEKTETDREENSWRRVRNTPFRKTIETVGSFFFDLLTLSYFTRTMPFGKSRHN